MKQSLLWGAFALLLTLVACGGDTATPNAAATESAATSDASAEAVTPTPAADEPLYAWVDNLNLRDAPSSSGKVIAKVPSGTTLTPTGRTSPPVESIVLRGGLYEEPWVEVRHAGDVVGWVFGGAVQRGGERKSAAVQRAGVIDYDKLGRFDLSEWRKVSEDKIGEVEMDGVTVTYRKGDNQLELTESSIGEFYSGNEQRLLTSGGTLLRERRFSWTADHTGGRLEETVTVYTGESPVRYERKQTTQRHFSEFDKQPNRVVGAWREVEIHDAPVAVNPGSTGTLEGAQAEVTGRWRSLDDPRSVLVIDETTFHYIYDGDASEAKQTYRRRDTCPESAGGRGDDFNEPGAFFVIDDDYDGRCLYLVSVTEDKMQLSNTGRGNQLYYERL